MRSICCRKRSFWIAFEARNKQITFAEMLQIKEIFKLILESLKDTAFKGTILNRTSQSCKEGYVEITFIFPLSR